MAKKKKTFFLCEECGVKEAQWKGRCPSCDAWGSLIEKVEAEDELSEKLKGHSLSSKKKLIKGPRFISLDQKINDLKIERYQSKMHEVDRVLGGGLVQGSFLLIGGEPGIGKSTLLMQYAGSLAEEKINILYISGEESIPQTGSRAQRLGVFGKNVEIGSENNLSTILEAAIQKRPHVLIIDSIQTLFLPELNAAPGTISQIRECTGHLMTFAKSQDIAVIIVGHVTKDGSIAGPKSLEHMVDTVLSFEGDINYGYRLLRTLKNRFGATHELGIFQMEGTGLKEISNPSEMFLNNREKGVIGSAVFATVEGSRPLLCEIQSLSGKTNMTLPRRTSVGIDVNRLNLLIAVVGKHLKILLNDSDIFVNVAGGLKITETAADLPVIASLLSTHLEMAIDSKVILFGEIGLTGEVRSVSFAEMRIREANKLGFNAFIIPSSCQKIIKELEITDGQVLYINHIKELPDILGSLR